MNTLLWLLAIGSMMVVTSDAKEFPTNAALHSYYENRGNLTNAMIMISDKWEALYDRVRACTTIEQRDALITRLNVLVGEFPSIPNIEVENVEIRENVSKLLDLMDIHDVHLVASIWIELYQNYVDSHNWYNAMVQVFKDMPRMIFDCSLPLRNCHQLMTYMWPVSQHQYSQRKYALEVLVYSVYEVLHPHRCARIPSSMPWLMGRFDMAYNLLQSALRCNYVVYNGTFLLVSQNATQNRYSILANKMLIDHCLSTMTAEVGFVDWGNWHRAFGASMIIEMPPVYKCELWHGALPSGEDLVGFRGVDTWTQFHYNTSSNILSLYFMDDDYLPSPVDVLYALENSHSVLVTRKF